MVPEPGRSRAVRGYFLSAAVQLRTSDRHVKTEVTE
jgi:hypothetical protein